MTDEALPDRIWTIPNALSLLRLLGVPLFLWLLLAEQADGWAFVVLVVAGASDWFDGWLARTLNQQSKWGALLDPLAARLYIAASLIGMALREIIPWWLVGVLAARELFLLCLVPMLRRAGRTSLPVTFVGKSATFALLWGFPIILLSATPAAVAGLARVLGWAFVLWGTALYWWAGIRYAQQALELRRSRSELHRG